MADNKKYYYLKLKEDFFDGDDMKLLQSMKDGYLYSDILLKLYLRSLRQNGRLMYRDIIPYTPEMVAAVTGHQVGTVERAMKILEQLGLIEILDNGAIYMSDIQNFIGQSSNEGDRKRAYRNLINAEKSKLLGKLDGTNVQTDAGQMSGQTSKTSGQMSDIRPPEIRDKRLENRDKNNNINTFARSADKQPSEQEADVEPIILNDGSEWRPTQALFAEYVRLYPKVDVKQQFNEMRGWCISNPQKRKTRRGVARFVNSWLSREQDKGGARGFAGYKPPREGYGNIADRLSREERGDLS